LLSQALQTTLLIMRVKTRHNAPAYAEVDSEKKPVCLKELGWKNKEPVRTRTSRQLLFQWLVCGRDTVPRRNCSEFEKEAWYYCLYGACRDLYRLTQGHPYHLAFVEVRLISLRHLTGSAAVLKVFFCLLVQQAH